VQCGQTNNSSSLLLSSLLLPSGAIGSTEAEGFGITNGFSFVLLSNGDGDGGDASRSL
jgi:hypothetical protein